MIKLIAYGARGIALMLTVLQLYSVVVTPLPLLMHYMLVLAALLLLVFGQKIQEHTRIVQAIDILGIVTTLAWITYFAGHFDRYVTRIAFVDSLTNWDVIAAFAMTICLLEASRRVAGWGLFTVAMVFVLYGFFGNYLPSSLYHSGLSVERFADIQAFSSNGVFGVPIGAVVSYIFYFILFATFLEISGGGQLFIDLAFFMTGRARGGPAKSAVIASGLMGSINGSAVANVVGTGTFTIPLMKRFGYKSVFAGAVEAASSTGGQLMPPIMGAAAFVMVELTGLSYVTILTGAAIPALLYYLAILFAVDLTAKRDGLVGMARSEMPDLIKGLMGRIHLLIPLGVLIWFLVDGSSLMMAAIYAFTATILSSYLRKTTRMSLRDILKGLERASYSILVVAIPCAVAGMIIGIIIQTGIGLKFTGFILTLAEGSLLLSLLAVMVACIILGMGMPTVSAYIMVAILMAPALMKLDLYVLSVHLFIFYFALLSFVTPPVALASYAAAAIAKANAAACGWQAFKLTLPGFLIPFAFIYNPALILNGTWPEIIWVTLTSALGVYALAGAMVGMHFRVSSLVERGLAIAAAVLLIAPDKMSDLAGLVMIGGVLTWQHFSKTEPSEATTNNPEISNVD